MKVYVIENPELGCMEQVMALLPEWRRKKVQSLAHDDDKINCGLSFLLLQYALLQNFGFSESAEFSYGAVGKPYLSEHSDTYFSISHCRNGICCCVGKFEMGIDIQDIRQYNYRTAKRVCTAGEIAALNLSDCSDRLFSMIWSVKESVGKMTGKGFQEGFPRIDALERIKNKSSSVYEAADYFISLTVRNSYEEIEAERVDVTSLLSFLQRRI